jgi:hypothetical protein
MTMMTGDRTPGAAQDGALPACLLVLVSAVLLGVRLHAASLVGWGDSEALYASWALHPAPAYLDHPGLVALFARALGDVGSVSPSPARAHLVTSFVATLVPWLGVLVARAAGASTRHAFTSGLVLAVAPITAVGLFGMTPDLLLAPLWLGAIGCTLAGLHGPGSNGIGPSRAAALVAAGLLAGTSVTAKAPGVLLVVGFTLALARVAASRAGDDAARAARDGARSMWPWAGLAAGLVPATTVVAHEARHGWPMIRHRLVDTQGAAGFSARNIGAVFGGQLAYLSPVLAVVTAAAVWDLWKRRDEDVPSRVLFAIFAASAGPLLLLCLWSRVAEPHWLAPAWLAVLVHGARRAEARFVRPALAIAATCTALAHAYVLVPASVRLAPDGVDMRADIASELYGWPEVLGAAARLAGEAGTPFDPEGREVVFVGPHWTICGQVQAGLRDRRVGCATPVPDDFDGWLPRPRWRAADHVVFVSDARFAVDPSRELPSHVLTDRRVVTIRRGGRVTRTFTLSLFARRGQV